MILKNTKEVLNLRMVILYWTRITPCLENGKISQVNFLDEEEIGFGSTELL